MNNKSPSYKKSLKLIMQIQNIRKKNNVNWMDMLRLAFKHDPKAAAKIIYHLRLGLPCRTPFKLWQLRAVLLFQNKMD